MATITSSENSQKLPSKIHWARILLLVYGWIEIVVGLYVVFFRSSTRVFWAGVLAVLVGVLYLYTAKGIRLQKYWSKVLGIILAILMLPSIPVGLILGVIILFCLVSNDANSWFIKSQGGKNADTKA